MRKGGPSAHGLGAPFLGYFFKFKSYYDNMASCIVIREECDEHYTWCDVQSYRIHALCTSPLDHGPLKISNIHDKNPCIMHK